MSKKSKRKAMHNARYTHDPKALGRIRREIKLKAREAEDTVEEFHEKLPEIRKWRKMHDE